MSTNTMRGLFFIMKGRYVKGVEPSFTNRESGDKQYVGGYDPDSDDTYEWYALMDCKTFHCVSCGGDFNKVLGGVKEVIKKFKGDAKKYFKHVSSITSDDYYETHYLGKRPLTHEQRVKKAEGRCPRVSPIMRCLYEQVYTLYGDYYGDEIEEMEDLAYEELKEEKPIFKSRKRMNKIGKLNTTKDTETHKKVLKKTPKETPVEKTPMKMVKPKACKGIRKLSITH